jgi:hypothetical protein
LESFQPSLIFLARVALSDRLLSLPTDVKPEGLLVTELLSISHFVSDEEKKSFLILTPGIQ